MIVRIRMKKMSMHSLDSYLKSIWRSIKCKKSNQTKVIHFEVLINSQEEHNTGKVKGKVRILKLLTYAEKSL